MARLLSRRPVAIQYVHAADGQLYEHRFTRGTHVELMPNGDTRLVNRTRGTTHTVRNGQDFLLNPPPERSMKGRNRFGQFTKGNPGRKKRRRPSSNPKYRKRAHAKKNARAVTASNPRKKKRRRPSSNPYVVTHQVRSVPNPRHKKRARPNPPHGMVKALAIEVAKNAGNAAVVLAGEFTATNVPQWVADIAHVETPNFFLNAGMELLTGVGGGLAISLASEHLGAMWMIGGFTALYRSVIKGAVVPFLSTGLSGATDRTAFALRGYMATRRRLAGASDGPAARLMAKRRIAGYVGSPMTSRADAIGHHSAQQQGQQ